MRTGWLIAFILIILAVFSPWGAKRYYQLEIAIKELSKDNGKLRQENRQLRQQIEKLTTDPVYIEKIAREKYGLIRHNEIIYHFQTPGKKE